MTARVRLRPVDDATLSLLVRAALEDAAPDEVTPPLTPGTPGRRSASTGSSASTSTRAGLDGPAGEATWAVELDGASSERSGSSARRSRGPRDRHLADPRRAGEGVGRRALGAVLEQAAALGAHEVRADTTRGNGPALAVLRDLGFGSADAGGDRVVGAAGDPGNDESPRSVTWGSAGGRYWDRTSDLFRVREARYRCANRPSRPCGRTLLRARAPRRRRGGDGI